MVVIAAAAVVVPVVAAAAAAVVVCWLLVWFSLVFRTVRVEPAVNLPVQLTTNWARICRRRFPGGVIACLSFPFATFLKSFQFALNLLVELS